MTDARTRAGAWRQDNDDPAPSLVRAGEQSHQGVLATDITRQSVTATPALVELLGLQPRAIVERIEVLHRFGGAPVMLTVDYVPPGREWQQPLAAAENVLATEVWRPPSGGSVARTFSAETAPPRLAELLGITPFAPVQYVQEVRIGSDGTAVGYRDVWVDTDRLRVRVTAQGAEMV